MQRAEAWARSLWPPISLAYIQALLRSEGFQTKLVDATALQYGFDEVLKLVEETSPDIIVVNSAIPTVRWENKLAKAMKEKSSNAIVAIIGMPPTLMPWECSNFDCLIRREPELAILDMVKDVARGYTLKKVYEHPVNDMNQLPLPDPEGLPLDRYKMPFGHGKLMLVEVARGCPFNCTFCVCPPYFGHKVRYRQVDLIAEEIRFLHEKGVKNFLFWSDTFTVNKKVVVEICKGIRELGLDVKWMAISRVDTIDREVLGEMKRSGCFMTSLGVESAVQQILDNVKKGITPDQSARAIKVCREVGVWSMCHLIFGLPGETHETAEHTINWILKQNPDYIQAYCAVAYPGTEFYAWAKEKGWIVSEDPSDMEIDKGNVRNYHLSVDDIRGLRVKAYRKFYGRAGFILRELSRHPSPKLMFDGMAFFKTWIMGRGKIGAAFNA
jgi:radical SAM superfamily enzyme YgiQ (UPF0313 family)